MNVSDFLKFFTSPHGNNKNWSTPGGRLVDTYNDTGIPWKFRWDLAEKIIGIDFQCDFQEGRCVAERHDKHSDSPTVVNHCCNQCYLTIGNLLYLPRGLPQNDQVLEEIASLFDPELRGFWRQDVGCILPHKYRSTICLTGRCVFLRRTTVMDKEDLLKLYRLSNIRTLWEK